MRVALQADQLVLHYLPIIELSTGEPRGVEALVRWQPPHHPLVMPDDFLPAVAHTPVMHDITRWVLNRGCREMSRWPHWTLSVNVAAREVTDPRLVEWVSETLARYGMQPRRLILELTEQAIVSDLEAATEVLGRLREIGVGLSLDDFGTGYSSLLYLRALPLTELKIDRVFVRADSARPADAAIVQSIVRLGRSVDLAVVAEGVETAATASRLRAMGCRSAQGYLWGPPRAAPDVAADVGKAWRATSRTRRPPIGSRAQLSKHVAQRIQRLLDDGASMHTIAAALNREHLETPHGTRWHASTVAQAVASLDAPEDAPHRP
ncbi:MAG: EAL domain-containing protein [Mycobacteriales bacterium]